MKHALEHRVGDSLINPKEPLEEPVVGVSLRPRDPFSKKLVSSAIECRNVLVKVTLPKRTGRKRKRGSNDPFTEPAEGTPRNDSITAPEFLKNMSIDIRPGASHIGNFVAPPSFMAANQPYRYEFNQASGVKFEQDASGNVTTTNLSVVSRR